MFGRLMLLGCCAVGFAQTGATIEGRVVTTSGAPLRRATVSLRFTTGVVQVSGINVASNATAESDGDGHFVFRNLSAGNVVVAANRPGYSDVNQNVTLAAGQRVSDITIKLPRLGVIYGKVVDEYGDPFARINVGLFRRVYENGWRWQQQNSITTGPDGTYAIGDLQQGRYYLAASDMLYNGSSQVTRYIQTFYPSATEPAGATGIDIGPEAELRGIDIRMQRGRIFRVSGKITSTEPLQGASVSLVPRDNTTVNLGRPTGGVNIKDNTFTVERVPEGAYWAIIQTQVRPPDKIDPAHPPVIMSGRELVTVSGRDVDDVVIPLGPGVDINGRVRVDGTLPPTNGKAQPVQPRIMLQQADGNPVTSAMSTVSQPDGTFAIRNISPGSYRVTATGLPNAYLSSVRYEGQDATWTPITVGSGGGGTIEAIFKTDGGKLSGAVHDEKGDPLTDARVTLWASNSRVGYVMSASTDRTGTYRYSNLPPGEYRVVVWDKKATATPGFNWPTTAPEYLHLFDTSAASVRVDASSEQTQDLNVTPVAAMDAALARLQ
jgi:hypothetical protein